MCHSRAWNTACAWSRTKHCASLNVWLLPWQSEYKYCLYTVEGKSLDYMCMELDCHHGKVSAILKVEKQCLAVLNVWLLPWQSECYISSLEILLKDSALTVLRVCHCHGKVSIEVPKI